MEPICGLETEDDDLPHECPHCGGSGTLLVCCDDICQGHGYCMHGDVVEVHCCDACARKAGVTPKFPADSGTASWLCDVCGHHGIGSLTYCEIGDWLRLRPLQPNAELTGRAEGEGPR